MVKINWTNEAKYWLKYIYEYIALDNPKAAKKVVNGIYERVGLLKTFPEMGYQFEHFYEKNIRIVMYGHYRIAYLIKKDDIIDILAILHGKMDINKYFEKYKF